MKINSPSGEPPLGKPASDGYVVASTAAGVRSWKDPATLVITTLTDGSDSTKHAAFDVSGVTTGTTRTLTVPNSNGTLAYTSDIPAGATSAQAATQTSSTTRLTPANIPFAVFGMNWKIVDLASSSSQFGFGTDGASAGSGTSAFSNSSLQVTSGATASSYKVRDTGNNITGLAPSTSALANGLNFDKMVGFTVTFRQGSGTTNGVNRFTLGNGVASVGSGNTGKLSAKGIGFEIRNATLYGAVHDGTTYTGATLGVTLTANAYTTVTCFRSAAGSWDFYVNGTYAATVTGGPTGTLSSHTAKVYATADNGSDAAAQDFTLFDTKIFQAL